MINHETGSEELLRLCNACVDEISERTPPRRAKGRRTKIESKLRKAVALNHRARTIAANMEGLAALFDVYCELRALVPPAQLGMKLH